MRERMSLALSMVIFGTISLFVRGIALPTAEIALCRAGIAALSLGAGLVLRGEKGLFRRAGRALPLLFLSGVLIGFNWILLFEAYRYTTVTLATLSYYFAPVLVTAACPLLFREKLTPAQLVCFLGSTAGLVLITGTAAAGPRDLRGILLGLGAAVLYASVVLLNKKIDNVGGVERTFFQFAAAFIVLLPYVLLTGAKPLSAAGAGGVGLLLALGLVHTALAYCLYFVSLRSLTGQEAAILSYLDPLTAVLLSLTVLHETVTPLQLAGGALILGFTLFNELRAVRRA